MPVNAIQMTWQEASLKIRKLPLPFLRNVYALLFLYRLLSLAVETSNSIFDTSVKPVDGSEKTSVLHQMF